MFRSLGPELREACRGQSIVLIDSFKAASDLEVVREELPNAMVESMLITDDRELRRTRFACRARPDGEWGHYQATGSLSTMGAEDDLASAVSECPDVPLGAVSPLTYSDPSGLRSVRESRRWLELLLRARVEHWSDAEWLAAIVRHAKSFGPVGELSDRLGTDPLELCVPPRFRPGRSRPSGPATVSGS